MESADFTSCMNPAAFEHSERGSSFIRIPPPPPKLVANNFDVSCWAQLPSRVLAEQMTLVDAYYVYSVSVRIL